MPSIFTRIIRGEIPAEKLAEDDRYLAFLDVRPIRPGHTLVIPKQETDYIFDLDDDLLGGLLPFARPVARALQAVCPCPKIGIMVAGLEVPHVHVHLVPMNSLGDLNFAHASPADPAELARLGAEVRRNLGQA